MTTRKARKPGVDVSAKALREFYAEEAKRLGLILDYTDDLLIENAANTAGIVADLQRSIEADGAVITNTAGTVKTNPACTEIRQQRLALAKLTTLISHNFTVAANAGRLTSTGRPPGSISPTGNTGITQRQAKATRRPQQRRNQPLPTEKRAR